MDCVAGALVFQQAFKQQCQWLQKTQKRIWHLRVQPQ